MRLRDRVAIITGASQGLGESIAMRLAEEGAVIAAADVRSCDTVVERIRSSGGQAEAYPTDVADRDQVEALCEAVVARWGRIDILVNNAGITRDALLRDMSDEQWDAVLATNLKGPFLMLRAATRGMVERCRGKVVNVASRAYLGNIGQINYAAAKGGLVSLTRTAALELARFRINVNCVAPGAIDTAMLAAVPQKVRDRMLAAVPLGRLGEARDVANAVLFLASDEADYITGQTLFVCGGRSIGAAPA